MSTRSASLWLATAFAALAIFAPLASCGPAKIRCTVSNCSGCCDENDECVAGNTFAACGINGATCLTCPSGNACEVGVCTSTGAGGGGGSVGGGGGATGGGGGATGGGGGATGGGGGATGGGGGATGGGGGGATGGGGGSVGGGGGSTGGGGGSVGGGGGSTGGGGGSSSVPALTSGQSVTSSGLSGDYDDYVINIPAGTAQLTIVSSGGTGDPDLYLMYNALPDPDFGDYDFISETNGTTESITVNNPTPGAWYLTVYGYLSYSNVTVTATW